MIYPRFGQYTDGITNIYVADFKDAYYELSITIANKVSLMFVEQPVVDSGIEHITRLTFDRRLKQAFEWITSIKSTIRAHQSEFIFHQEKTAGGKIFHAYCKSQRIGILLESENKYMLLSKEHELIIREEDIDHSRLGSSKKRPIAYHDWLRSWNDWAQFFKYLQVDLRRANSDYQLERTLTDEEITKLTKLCVKNEIEYYIKKKEGLKRFSFLGLWFSHFDTANQVLEGIIKEQNYTFKSALIK